MLLSPARLPGSATLAGVKPKYRRGYSRVGPSREGARMSGAGRRERRLGATWCLAALLLLLTACTGSARPRSHALPRPRPSPLRAHTIYRPAKMDRVAHFLSKYWDGGRGDPLEDRKSTRLNSSHITISYAV